jgi:threonine dehydrogenase-like Zn-dependent dehydrogenase
VVFEAMECLGKNGVLVLASVTGGDREHSVPSDKINLDFVLGNKLVVGTVNANREYFEAGVYDFARAELEFPGWLPKLLTHPVTGLENYQDMMQTLTTERSAIKVFVNVAYDYQAAEEPMWHGGDSMVRTSRTTQERRWRTFSAFC